MSGNNDDHKEQRIGLWLAGGAAALSVLVILFYAIWGWETGKIEGSPNYGKTTASETVASEAVASEAVASAVIASEAVASAPVEAAASAVAQTASAAVASATVAPASAPEAAASTPHAHHQAASETIGHHRSVPGERIMRVVVQRVNRAKVTVAGETVGQIGKGFLALVGAAFIVVGVLVSELKLKKRRKAIAG